MARPSTPTTPTPSDAGDGDRWCVISIVTAVLTALVPAWAMTAPGIVAFIAWNAVVWCSHFSHCAGARRMFCAFRDGRFATYSGAVFAPFLDMASSTTGTQPIQHVHRRHGTTDQTMSCAVQTPDAVHVPTIADLVPVTQIMTREITCAHRELEVDQLVDLVVRNRIGCVPIVEAPGRPIGMVTKLDIVERLFSRDGSDPPRTAGELMLPLAITLGEHATIAHAAALMAAEDVHHIPIVDTSGCMIGIVSTLDIVRWLAKNDGYGRR
jgi:CBS domain-containing protein